MKTKTKLLIVVFLLLFLCLILISLSIFLFKRIEKTSNKILEIKQKDLTLARRIKNIEEFERLKNDKKEDLSKLESIFFSKDLPLPFVTFLENAARENQLPIQISTPEILKKEKENLPSVYFEIKFEGSLDSIFIFLKKIEEGPFLIQFEKMRISKMKEGENLEGDVFLKAFVKE